MGTLEVQVYSGLTGKTLLRQMPQPVSSTAVAGLATACYAKDALNFNSSVWAPTFIEGVFTMGTCFEGDL